MVDVAPHFAMQGQNLKYPAIGSPLERDPSPFNGVYNRYRHGPDLALPDPIARFLDPLHYTRTSASERSTLSSLGRSLHFEVPVMLNPGELLSTNSRQNSLAEDNNVHLHINAQVHMPGRLFLMQTMTAIEEGRYRTFRDTRPRRPFPTKTKTRAALLLIMVKSETLLKTKEPVTRVRREETGPDSTHNKHQRILRAWRESPGRLKSSGQGNRGALRHPKNKKIFKLRSAKTSNQKKYHHKGTKLYRERLLYQQRFVRS